MTEEKKFTVQDPDFPQVAYDISQEEFVTKLRDSTIPTWWKIQNITKYADDLIIIMKEEWRNEKN